MNRLKKAQSIACTKCGAEAGQRCKTLGERDIPAGQEMRTSVHTVRLLAAVGKHKLSHEERSKINRAFAQARWGKKRKYTRRPSKALVELMTEPSVIEQMAPSYLAGQIQEWLEKTPSIHSVSLSTGNWTVHGHRAEYGFLFSFVRKEAQ